jgi:hypothetical protein
VNEHLTTTGRPVESDSTFWLWCHSRMKQWWQWWRPLWWITYELLKKPDMEDIMQLGTRGQSEADNNLVDALGDAIWPNEPWFELARGQLR